MELVYKFDPATALAELQPTAVSVIRKILANPEAGAKVQLEAAKFVLAASAENKQAGPIQVEVKRFSLRG